MVVGPEGAGKTTFIATLLDPAKGVSMDEKGKLSSKIKSPKTYQLHKRSNTDISLIDTKGICLVSNFPLRNNPKAQNENQKRRKMFSNILKKQKVRGI